MNPTSEWGSSFAQILPGDATSAAIWDLPNFDAFLRRPPPPPTAQALEDIEAAAHREGQERGYAEGYAQGLGEGRTEVRAQAGRLAALLDHLAAPVADVDAKTEQALVALMLELARRLVQQELALEPAKMLAIVRDAVGHLAGPVRNLRVRLNPEDLRVVAGHLDAPTGIDAWVLVPDGQLMQGDCIVENESARVDARLDTRQAQLAQRLLGEGT
ncbi:MAG: FliH/SctL family protein [Panacagrimonas sp.]